MLIPITFCLRVLGDHAIIATSHQEARQVLIVKKLLCRTGVELADKEAENPKDMLNPYKSLPSLQGE